MRLRLVLESIPRLALFQIKLEVFMGVLSWSWSVWTMRFAISATAISGT